MKILDSLQRDHLTGFYMKDRIVPFLEKCAAEYSAHNEPFSVLMVDLDGFKSFNDKHGHACGDEALQYFSSSIRLSLDGQVCVMFRFGGDEFVLAFPGRSPKATYQLAATMEENIKNRPFLFRGREYDMSFSGGIASCPQDGKGAADILEKADKAMYFSKRRGRGRITEYATVRAEFIASIVRIMSGVAVILFLYIMARDFFRIDAMWIVYEKVEWLSRVFSGR